MDAVPIAKNRNSAHRQDEPAIQSSTLKIYFTWGLWHIWCWLGITYMELKVSDLQIYAN